MDEDVVIPIVAILMPLVLVPTVMVLKGRLRRREYEHRERMKSLEMGVPVHQRHPWPAALTAIALGLGAPGAAFFFSWLAVETAHSGEGIFVAAMVVGVAGVLTGGRLAMRLMPSHAVETSEPESLAHRNGKPAFDPDTFDVVGRRG